MFLLLLLRPLLFTAIVTNTIIITFTVSTTCTELFDMTTTMTLTITVTVEITATITMTMTLTSTVQPPVLSPPCSLAQIILAHGAGTGPATEVLAVTRGQPGFRPFPPTAPLTHPSSHSSKTPRYDRAGWSVVSSIPIRGQVCDLTAPTNQMPPYRTSLMPTLTVYLC